MATARVEILSRIERRRRWSDEEKLRLLEEAAQPGARVSAVARRHGVCRSLLFIWRRQHRCGLLPAPAPAFVPVQIGSEPADAIAAQTVATAADRGAGMMEVELPNGCRIRVDRTVDARALRRVLAALTGR